MKIVRLNESEVEKNLIVMGKNIGNVGIGDEASSFIILKLPLTRVEVNIIFLN